MTTLHRRLVLLLILILPTYAEAVGRVWNGSSNTSWSDAANWNGGIAPSPGDDLTFPAAAMRTTNVNDFAAGTTFGSITFNDTYSVSGNAIVLTGGLHATTVAPTVITIDLPITQGAAQIWDTDATASIYLFQLLHLNGHPLAVNGAGLVRVIGPIEGVGGVSKDGTGDLILEGANSYSGITSAINGRLVVRSNTALGIADGTDANGTYVAGPAALVVNGVDIGNEALRLNNVTIPSPTPTLMQAEGTPSSWAGTILIGPTTAVNLLGTTLTLSGVVSGQRLGLGNNGTLILANNANTFFGVDFTAFGAQTSTLVMAKDHALPQETALTLPAGTTLRIAPGVNASLNGLSGAGQIDLPLTDCALNVTGSATNDTFTGTITGAGALSLTGGGGHLTITTNSPAFTGLLIVDFGSTITLSGTVGAKLSVRGLGHMELLGGSVGSIDVVAGELELHGDVTSTTNPGAPWGVALAPHPTHFFGTAPATLPTLTAAGAANLGHRVNLLNSILTLHLPAGFAPAMGTVFTLIHNEPGGDVYPPTTFRQLAEGDVFAVSGIGFKISYVGGSGGHDVTLTVVPAPREYLLSEGATNGFFTTDILLANPNDVAATVHLKFLLEGGATRTLDDALPAKSHKLIRVNDVPGMETLSFSTIVRSNEGLPLAVERTMSWNRSSYGAHTEHATDGPSTTWYFAEGSQGFFHTYLLLANPQIDTITATVQYLRENEAPLTRTYVLGATSRLTVDALADPELANRSFGMVVTFDQPGGAERAMYFGDAPLFNGGHESAGVPQPSTTWFLAEGATGPFFETFILLANPTSSAVDATMTYLPASGMPITKIKNIPANGRITVNLETEDPALANAAVSTQVVATQPILVERSQYWPDPAPQWYEAHNSFGVTGLGTKWALAEGRVGAVDGIQGAQTYILLANPGTTPATVSITFLRDSGAAPVTKQFTVPPTSRFNVTVGPGTDVPELANEHFGALVTSDQPIAVERALYWDANGQIWAAGTNATAMRLP